jgi:hypothetical protein
MLYNLLELPIDRWLLALREVVPVVEIPLPVTGSLPSVSC